MAEVKWQARRITDGVLVDVTGDTDGVPQGAPTPNALEAGAVSELTIFKQSVTLTDAQIKALPTTAIELVPAPGADQFIAPIAAWFFVDWTADYTNLGSTARIGVGYAGTFTSVLAEFDGTGVADLLADGASHVAYQSMASRVATVAVPSTTKGQGQFLDEPGAVNAALELYAGNTGTATGDFTGGHANNRIIVVVWYGVMDVS